MQQWSVYQLLLSLHACDGNLDCTDSSDEAGCSKLPKYFWGVGIGNTYHGSDSG